MKSNKEKDIIKIIDKLLFLISHDYDCDCHLASHGKQIFLYSLLNTDTYTMCTFKGTWIRNYFISLNDMLQTFLDPTYELWIYDHNYNRCNINIAKKYGSTIEQLKITFDLRVMS